MKPIDHFKRYNFTRIIPVSLILLLVASHAWAANAAESGRSAGSIMGAIVGAIVGVIITFKIHPVFGVLTAIGALAAIGKMLG